MDRREALSLATLVEAAAPWAEDIYVLPVNPAEQQFPEGLYMVSVSSVYLRAEVHSLQEWLEMLQQPQPSLGPARLPLINEHQFNEWVRKRLARIDVDEREQRCSTKDLSLFARRPWLNTLNMEVPFKQIVAPVVMSFKDTQNATQPTEPEMMLTVRWNCPICGSLLSLAKRLPATVEDRISIPGSFHSATGTEKSCPADVWLIIEQDEEEREPFSVYVRQVVRQQKIISEAQN